MTEERRTLGVVYITKETVQGGETLPFEYKGMHDLLNVYYTQKHWYEKSTRHGLPLPSAKVDWSKRIGQEYYKLTYCSNYPSFEESQDLLIMRNADRDDRRDEDNPRIKLADFGEGKDKLFLSFDRERLYSDDPLGNPYFNERDAGRSDRKRLEIIGGVEEYFCAQIPGTGGLTSPKRFISTAQGTLTFQKNFYDELREIYIDQKRVPFAGLRRIRVGWIEGNEFMDGYPKFDFIAYRFDGKKWGERMRGLENGFYFREHGEIKTLSAEKIIRYLESEDNLAPRDLQLVRLPGHETKGIAFGKGKAYEIEMNPFGKTVKISGLRKLPFENIIYVAPISSQEINGTFLDWIDNPQKNPYKDLANWICRLE